MPKRTKRQTIKDQKEIIDLILKDREKSISDGFKWHAEMQSEMMEKVEPILKKR